MGRATSKREKATRAVPHTITVTCVCGSEADQGRLEEFATRFGRALEGAEFREVAVAMTGGAESEGGRRGRAER